jgi:hypothetical protein
MIKCFADLLEDLSVHCSQSVDINGVSYKNIEDAVNGIVEGPVTIVFNKREVTKEEQSHTTDTVPSNNTSPDSKIYRIRVRQYMTKPSSSGFDFQDKWNNGIPMPMRVMVGKVLKETKGMYQMELWGAITEEQTSICMVCGRPLTNPVSRFFGVGPECGGHNYVNPFDTPEELAEAVRSVNSQLHEKKWTGWVIKSAIEEFEEVEENG